MEKRARNFVYEFYVLEDLRRKLELPPKSVQEENLTLIVIESNKILGFA